MTLTVAVVDAHASAQTAAPGMTFRLRIEEGSGACVHALLLRCQARIDPRGRRYTKDEQARLYELFGDVSQWDRTLRAVTLANAAMAVPTFTDRIEVDLAIPCTYDLEIASAKYLHAVRDGDVPLVFLFSGTAFRAGGWSGGSGEKVQPDPPDLPGLPDRPGLLVEPVPWDLEASFRLPSSVWRAAMDQFFPGGGWLRLQRETLDRLQAFRGRQAVVTWDEAIDRLLDARAATEEIA